MGSGEPSFALASGGVRRVDGVSDMSESWGWGTLMGASNAETRGGEKGGAGLGEREQDLMGARRGGGKVSQT